MPDLAVHRDHQIYEPKGTRFVRFRSPEADFERMIELTPAGFVLDYPGIARLVTTVVRIPLHAIDDWDSFDAIVGGALELPHAPRSDAWIDCLSHCDDTQGGRLLRSRAARRSPCTSTASPASPSAARSSTPR